MAKTYRINDINVSRYKEFAMDDKGRICLFMQNGRKAVKAAGFVGFYGIEEMARQFARADFHDRSIVKYDESSKTFEDIITNEQSVHVEFKGAYRYDSMDFFKGLRQIDGGFLFEQFVLTEDKLEDWKPKRPGKRKKENDKKDEKKPAKKQARQIKKVKAA